MDRADYFANDAPTGIHHPPNIQKSFGTFKKHGQQPPQPPLADNRHPPRQPQNQPPPASPPPLETPAEPQVVRKIPIQVEGRDKPLINTFSHFGDSKPYPPNMDRADYFINDAPTGIHHPPNIQKSFGTFKKHGQQPPQPPLADNRHPPRQPQNQPPPASPPPLETPAEPQVVRKIPIQVEGRDKPLINTFSHFGDSKPYPPNMDRADYFINDAPTGIHHPPNIQKSFGTFKKHGQQPPQPPLADNRHPPRQPQNQPPPASPPPLETPAEPQVVRKIPIQVEGRDKPLINTFSHFGDSKPYPPNMDRADYFINDAPTGIYHPPNIQKSFGTFKKHGQQPPQPPLADNRYPPRQPPNQPPPASPSPLETPAEPQVVRKIPIQVEGRDKPLINTFSHFGDSKPYPPNMDRADYFINDAPTGIYHPPNIQKSFGTFKKHGQQPPQPPLADNRYPPRQPPNQPPPASPSPLETPAEPQVVRKIPIQVEGRDKPLINTFSHFGDSKPYPPNMDRADYFINDAPTGIHHPPNIQKSFGTFKKHGQQPPQPPLADSRYPPRQPPNQPPPASPPPLETPAEPQVVRKIPIQVEGRDKPVINTFSHFGDSKPYPPNMDRADYFINDAPTAIHHPQMQKSYGAFHKHGQQPPQPFSQQKIYPQSATRGGSSHRTQPPNQPPPASPLPESPTAPKPQPTPVYPITQILATRNDVFNLRRDIQKFTGSKKDKTYNYIEEMLIRNLVKLVLIECDNDYLKQNIKNEKIFILYSMNLLEYKAGLRAQEMRRTMRIL